MLQEVSGMLRPTAMTAFYRLSKISRPKTLSLISGVSETLDGTAILPYTDEVRGWSETSSETQIEYPATRKSSLKYPDTLTLDSVDTNRKKV